jgi:hypothetical protein
VAKLQAGHSTNRGCTTGRVKRLLSSPAASILTVGPHAAFYSIDIEGSFPGGYLGVRRPGCGAYNASPSVRDMRPPPHSRCLRFCGLLRNVY